MLKEFYKYQGAGNDFIIFNALRKPLLLTKEQIIKLCDRHYGIGADGVMILSETAMADFYMQFFNPDGTGGMMCGNGGRCISMFAKHVGAVKNDVMSFAASDGIHFARITDESNVALKMSNVTDNEMYEDGFWLNTGTSHFVTFIDGIKKIDVYKKGKKLREDKRFAKHEGVNVNFVQTIGSNELIVRTYEKGVENETLACGTGITASALAYSLKENLENGKHSVKVHALKDDLTVEFNKNENKFDGIILTGTAKKVFEGKIDL